MGAGRAVMPPRHPDLTRLVLPTRARYPENDPPVAWVNRLDLVEGGCIPEERGTDPKLQTNCYERWSSELRRSISAAPTADTVLLLSVGAGVLELKALVALEKGRRVPPRVFLRHVWLVDPMTDHDKAAQVKEKFEETFKKELGRVVEVHYFYGAQAYADAEVHLLSQLGPDGHVGVGVVGALNYSLGPLQLSPEGRKAYVKAPDFLQLVKDASNFTGLQVVQAYWNSSSDFASPRVEFVHRYRSRVYMFVYEESMKDQRDLLQRGSITPEEYDANVADIEWYKEEAYALLAGVPSPSAAAATT